MKFYVRALAVIAGFLLSVASAAAAITHINVDDQTAGGPIETVGGSISLPDLFNKFTVSGTAHNTSGQTYNDVRFLMQFMYSTTPAAAMTFTDGTDTWTTGSRNYNALSPSGTFNMSNTNAPLNWTFTGTATLGATDTVPYYSIGTLGPGASMPFTFDIQGSTADSFQFVGSYVALPEPSTFVMLGLGGVALFSVRRRRAK